MSKKSKLRPCVDCGTPLSPTAAGCGVCNSTDPFGVKRAEAKFTATVVLLALAVVLGMAALWKLTGITPIELLNADFQKLRNHP